MSERVNGSHERLPDPDMSERLPTPAPPGDRIFLSGKWRSAEGAERVRARWRIRQRERRQNGTGR